MTILLSDWSLTFQMIIELPGGAVVAQSPVERPSGILVVLCQRNAYTPTEPPIWSRPSENAELNCGKWLEIIRVVNVKCAATVNVRVHYRFIISIRGENHSGYRTKE